MVNPPPKNIQKKNLFDDDNEEEIKPAKKV
jgi:hypothetical protein